MYLYVQTTVPSQVIGSGVETEPIGTGSTGLPHSSKILAGGPGSMASAGQDTVEVSFAGAVSSGISIV